MKYNELRYGNLIYYKGEAIMATSNDISMLWQFDNMGVENKIYAPITLTAEILEKSEFEFHHTGSDYYYQKGNLFISQYLNYLIYDFNGDYLWSERMSWVHQVQNLYFSLHQKELTINL